MNVASAPFLALAEADLDAAEILARVGNHHAAYHVQQAIEHRLETLADRLPEKDVWHSRVAPWLRCILEDVKALRVLLASARDEVAPAADR